MCRLLFLAGWLLSGCSFLFDAPQGELAVDEFERELSIGWGEADLGGLWTVSDTQESAVAGGVGRLTLSKPGANRAATLLDSSFAEVDLRFEAGANKIAIAGGIHFTAVLRRNSKGHEYYASIVIRSEGEVALSISKRVGAEEMQIAFSQPILNVDVMDRLQLRAQAQSQDPTILRLKVWKAGMDEPADWSLVATDYEAGLQAEGSVGMRAYLSQLATNAPVEAEFDHFSVRKIAE